MKAAIFKGPGKIAIEERPRPVVEAPTDAVVRVVRACVCGSDLWYFRGQSPHDESGIGHEAVGVVESIGGEVSTLAPGDLVVVPFAYSDNNCPNCQFGFQTACTNGGFFGGGDLGAQAEYLRVPLADGTAVKVPAGDYSDEQLASLLTLSDVMGTGYHAAVSAGVKPGHTVAVVGDGAVGLSGVLAAKLLGAGRIIVLGSTHKTRHQLAKKWGADEIITERDSQAIERAKQLTDSIGVDAVLECVGSKSATDTAFAIARAGAVIGRVGVPHGATIDETMTFYRNLGVRGGPAPVRQYLPDLLDLTLKGEINPGEVFDFTTDLDHIADAYQAMDERRAIKALIKVSEI